MAELAAEVDRGASDPERRIRARELATAGEKRLSRDPRRQALPRAPGGDRSSRLRPPADGGRWRRPALDRGLPSQPAEASPARLRGRYRRPAGAGGVSGSLSQRRSRDRAPDHERRSGRRLDGRAASDARLPVAPHLRHAAAREVRCSISSSLPPRARSPRGTIAGWRCRSRCRIWFSWRRVRASHGRSGWSRAATGGRRPGSSSRSIATPGAQRRRGSKPCAPMPPAARGSSLRASAATRTSCSWRGAAVTSPSRNATTVARSRGRRCAPVRCSSPTGRSTARNRSSTGRCWATGAAAGAASSAGAGTPVAVWLTDPNGEKVAEATRHDEPVRHRSGRVPDPRRQAPRAVDARRARSAGEAAVRVEEYKRPTFEVEVAEPAGADLRLNRPAELTGEARYYFGLPVTAGNVAWRVTRQPEHPLVVALVGLAGGATAAQPIASGTTTLAADGKFRVAFTPAADERRRRRRASPTSIAWRPTSPTKAARPARGERTVRLGWSAVEARRPRSRPTSRRRASRRAIAVRRQDLDGAPRPGEGSWRLLRSNRQPRHCCRPTCRCARPTLRRSAADRFATPGDRLRPRWDRRAPAEQALAFFADGKEVAQRRGCAHEADGSRIDSSAGLAAGAYRLRYETRDDFGENGPHPARLRRRRKRRRLSRWRLDLAFDHATAEPGAQARLLAPLGTEDARPSSSSGAAKSASGVAPCSPVRCGWRCRSPRRTAAGSRRA